MSEFYFKDNQFQIEEYDKQKTFSSFLPGLAGKKGIPLWAFYVNRGQGIASFGIENKDSHILEFNPAVTAYERTAIDGFRTFVKVNGEVIEIFGENSKDVKRTMKIGRAEFSIVEVNKFLGLTFEVTYFGLPNENIAALVRQVKITNQNSEPVSFEILDGLSQLFPYKVEYGSFKAMSNLLRSWMEIYSLDNNIGYYRMRSSTSDSAEVTNIVKGNFYVSSFEGNLIKPIVDSSLVFGYDTSKRYARNFEKTSLVEILSSNQVTANKIPVGFTGVNMTIVPGEEKSINTVIGHAHSEEQVIEMSSYISDSEYLAKKRFEASNEIEQILQDVQTETAFPLFDDYIKQNYMDNFLRGGYPMVIDGDHSKFVYHLFSRKHGDLERDYNYFTLAPEFYSQGNGNFRDVCQNRRSDILIIPEVYDFNVKMFGSFIQADGYNPLAINGSSFEIKDKAKVKMIVNKLFQGSEVMMKVLHGKFSPGSIINTIANNNITTDLSDTELFEAIFTYAVQNFEANFGEGYWIDHWTYILDLIENFNGIYPDRLKDSLFNDMTYSFYDSPVHVLPRSEKICLRNDGVVRRYGSVIHHDHAKIDRLSMNPHGSNWLKDQYGREVKTNLFAKLFTLAVNKVASIDPSGIGIEMEADKPGWNDAMNGLPGLFGSGVSETIELKRILSFLSEHFLLEENLELPVEMVEFSHKLLDVLNNTYDDFDYWNKASSVKEDYRDAIRFGTKEVSVLDGKTVSALLEEANKKIDVALTKALHLGNGIYPTYLVHEVVDYERVIENGSSKIGQYGLPIVTPKKFKVRALPYYLEAPARALKVMNNIQKKKRMYENIKLSNVYDHELKFYKTSEFLDDETNEIGRGRSFTKGWQERESNFLHMTYKYLLGLLKGGLYKEFFEEIETNLVCFMDPKVYGRSTLENSSFIASSVNPDPSVRGQGWVARLSGSTAEMLSIWAYMMFGKKPFIMTEGTLTLNLHPALSTDFFKDGEVSFTFLGSIKVTYINSQNINTFDPSFAISKYEVDGKEYKEISGKLAEKVRNKQVQNIKVYF
jgi:hypothetical protein